MHTYSSFANPYSDILILWFSRSFSELGQMLKYNDIHDGQNDIYTRTYRDIEI